MTRTCRQHGKPHRADILNSFAHGQGTNEKDTDDGCADDGREDEEGDDGDGDGDGDVIVMMAMTVMVMMTVMMRMAMTNKR